MPYVVCFCFIHYGLVSLSSLEVKVYTISSEDHIIFAYHAELAIGLPSIKHTANCFLFRAVPTLVAVGCLPKILRWRVVRSVAEKRRLIGGNGKSLEKSKETLISHLYPLAARCKLLYLKLFEYIEYTLLIFSFFLMLQHFILYLLMRFLKLITRRGSSVVTDSPPKLPPPIV